MFRCIVYWKDGTKTDYEGLLQEHIDNLNCIPVVDHIDVIKEV